MAIAVKTGRMKDAARLAQFLEAGRFDETRLFAILDRYGLRDRFEVMRRGGSK